LQHTDYQLLQFSWRLFLTIGKGSLSAAAQLFFHACLAPLSTILTFVN
jgi:hypothetical protein